MASGHPQPRRAVGPSVVSRNAVASLGLSAEVVRRVVGARGALGGQQLLALRSFGHDAGLGDAGPNPAGVGSAGGGPPRDGGPCLRASATTNSPVAGRDARGARQAGPTRGRWMRFLV